MRVFFFRDALFSSVIANDAQSEREVRRLRFGDDLQLDLESEKQIQEDLLPWTIEMT